MCLWHQAPAADACLDPQPGSHLGLSRSGRWRLRTDSLSDPQGDSEAGTDKLLDSCFAAIFEQELESWCLDRTAWPEPRTLRLFRDWFELTFYDLVEDLADEELCDESASLIDQQQTLDVRQPSERQPLRLVQGFGGS